MRNFIAIQKTVEGITIPRSPNRKRAKSLFLQFYIITSLLWLSGVGVLVIGILINADMISAQALVGTFMYKVINHIFVTSGVIVIILGFAYWGVSMRIRWDTVCMFSYVVALVLLLHMVVCALSFSWRSDISIVIRDRLSSLVKRDYIQDLIFTPKEIAFEYVQQRFHCCGANDFTDWRNSTWMMHETRNGSAFQLFPLSCCKADANEGTCNTEKGNVSNTVEFYSKGCIIPVTKHLEWHLLIMGVISLVAALIDSFVFVTANTLLFKID